MKRRIAAMHGCGESEYFIGTSVFLAERCQHALPAEIIMYEYISRKRTTEIADSPPERKGFLIL